MVRQSAVEHQLSGHNHIYTLIIFPDDEDIEDGDEDEDDGDSDGDDDNDEDGDNVVAREKRALSDEDEGDGEVAAKVAREE